LFLTGNTEMGYTRARLDLKNRPVVVESSLNTIGILDDCRFHLSPTGACAARPDQRRQLPFPATGDKGTAPEDDLGSQSRTPAVGW